MMSTEQKMRSELDPAFTWDLSDLFESDEAWEEAFSAIDAEIQKLSSFQGTLNCAEGIRAWLDFITPFEKKAQELLTYSSLRHSEDLTDARAQSMYLRAIDMATKAGAASAFAEPEILSLDETALPGLLTAESLAPFRFALSRLIEQKPHTLTAEMETLLADFSASLSAPGRIAQALRDADLTFEPVRDSKGETHDLSGASFILLQNSPDRSLRKNAFDSFYKGYGSHIHTFAETYAAAVGTAAAEARNRAYASSLEMSMKGEGVPLAVYDSLIESVHEHMDAMHDYVRLRKKMLGLEELHYYDLYTPLVPSTDRRYSYETAKEMVLHALRPLGEDYTALIERAYAERWIDVYPNKGKQGGAYSSICYDHTPHVLMNFTGTLDSVSTLAHELGHSMHTYYASHAQPLQYMDYTLFVAEVASTVNENLLVEDLLDQTEDPAQRIAFYNQYLEGFKGTVYRQTMFAEFEREAHAMAGRGEALTSESLGALYEQLIRLYFGEELTLDAAVSLEWARIPHFYRPFYVYKYATSYCSAAALSEMIRSGDPGAAARYLDFLSMGGSALPLDELRCAGVDLATKEPFARALSKFKKILAKTEQTFDSLH